MLLVAPGLTTRNKNATRSKGHRYQEQGRKRLLGAKGIATRSKDATSSSWPYY